MNFPCPLCSLLPLQKSLKKEHYLWQLFNIEKDITKANEDVDNEKKSREDVMRELENFEREASKKKKEQAKYLKEIALCEKKIAERSSRLDRSVSILCLLKAVNGCNIYIFQELIFLV